MAKITFISGLPRSGSTLFAAILRQNPRFSAGMSSPLFGMFSGLIATMGGEGRVLIDDSVRRRVLRGLFESWVGDNGADVVTFDTNRGWSARLAALVTVMPEARVICLVRSVASIMDSIERLIRVNPLLPSRLFSDDERANVYTRTEALAQRTRLVGSAWCGLKEAYYGPDANRLLVIEYEYLTRSPARVMELVYQFIGEPAFAHDFENVDFDQPEFDDMLATPGLHRVKRKVQFEQRPTILPPDLYKRFAAQNFWVEPSHSAANLIAPKRK
jgi:sulfotransferase